MPAVTPEVAVYLVYSWSFSLASIREMPQLFLVCSDHEAQKAKEQMLLALLKVEENDTEILISTELLHGRGRN